MKISPEKAKELLEKYPDRYATTAVGINWNSDMIMIRFDNMPALVKSNHIVYDYECKSMIISIPSEKMPDLIEDLQKALFMLKEYAENGPEKITSYDA